MRSSISLFFLASAVALSSANPLQKRGSVYCTTDRPDARVFVDDANRAIDSLGGSCKQTSIGCTELRRYGSAKLLICDSPGANPDCESAKAAYREIINACRNSENMVGGANNIPGAPPQGYLLITSL